MHLKNFYLMKSRSYFYLFSIYKFTPMRICSIHLVDIGRRQNTTRYKIEDMFKNSSCSPEMSSSRNNLVVKFCLENGYC